MSNQCLTQCPHCNASFKVSEEQINAAQGRVRCGSCMNIFDAIAYSITRVAPNAKESATEQPSSDSPPIELENAILDEDVDVGEESLFADDPEQDQQDASYSGQGKIAGELSTSFLELDNRNSIDQDPYSTSFHKIDDDTYPDGSLKEDVDESWTKDVLEEMKTEIDDKKIEPHISGIFSDTSSDNRSDNLSDSFSNVVIDKSSESIISGAEQPQENFKSIVRDPANFLTDSSSSNEKIDYENLNFHYQQDSNSKRNNWLGLTLFSILNTLLILVLVAQASWFHYEKLVKYPAFESLYNFACEQLNCTLPKLSNISKIRNQNLVVRSLPTTQKALIIDTIIINEADFDQDFPNIALYFTDINKHTVAQRLIKPNEYLSGELRAWKNMPSNQPIHISLEIIDPGKEAVNYKLAFFSPEGMQKGISWNK